MNVALYMDMKMALLVFIDISYWMFENNSVIKWISNSHELEFVWYCRMEYRKYFE